MSVVTRLLVLAAPVLLAGCGCCVAPAPSTPAFTPSGACLDAWVMALASPSEAAAVEAPMHACRSLDDFYYADQAAHAGDLAGANPKLIAEAFCATGRFNDTPICRGLGMTPLPVTPTPGGT